MNYSTVPHLTTASNDSLDQIEQYIADYQLRTEAWFRDQWSKVPIPFYASVDLRNSGYKLAPVDTNLFPAGFNNLNPAFEPLCIQALRLAVERLPHQVARILVIPENHTRNLFYLESLAALKNIIEKAGFEVRLGLLGPDIQEKTVLTIGSGKSLCLEPLQRSNDKIYVDDFVPQLILLNNDLSSGCPDILKSLDQTVTPSPEMGWSNRQKSYHFRHYQRVAAEFAQYIDIDSWLIGSLFRNCGEIDFMRREGNDCLQKNVGILLEEIQRKYDEYKIDRRPYAIIKADRGTYGMAIMTVNSVDDVTELSRKKRSHMSKTKAGQKVTKVIIQEGVYTHETWGQPEASAEPVVYMIDHNVVGGFYRVNALRSVNENLNAPGMRFEPLAFDSCCISPGGNAETENHQNRFYVYGVVARLALLAAATESQNC